jgi:hypothetical protein
MSPPPSIIDDPEHWLQRAKEARHVAGRLADPASKAAMLRIAADCEQIAEQARLRAQGARPKVPSRKDEEP